MHTRVLCRHRQRTEGSDIEIMRSYRGFSLESDDMDVHGLPSCSGTSQQMEP